MQRLSRAQSQERTRAGIVEAAITLFLRDGFRTTSLEQIAEQAGYTRGAVYSNFANKTELGVAAIDAIYQREAQRIVERLTAALDERPDAWIAALTDWGDSLLGNRRVARLEIEVAAFSAHDSTLGDAGAARYRRLREMGEQLLTRVQAQTGQTLPASNETIMLGIVGLALGIGLQRAADPSVPKESLGELLTMLITPTR